MELGKTYLKIKIKSLASEARIIKNEERKLKKAGKGPEMAGLTNHRKQVVRKEARYTLIAYGYLRGRAYSDIEQHADSVPYWDYIKKMVVRYGNKDQVAGFDEWVKATQKALI